MRQASLWRALLGVENTVIEEVEYDEDGLRRVGAEAGRLTATLAGMPTIRFGRWADGDLRIEPWDVGGLPAWVERQLGDADGWVAAEVARLVADRAARQVRAIARTGHLAAVAD